MKKFIFFFLILFAALSSRAQIQTINNGETGLVVRNKLNSNFSFLKVRTDSIVANLGGGGGGAFWPLTGNATLTGSVVIDGGFNGFQLHNTDAISLSTSTNNISITAGTLSNNGDVAINATDVLTMGGFESNLTSSTNLILQAPGVYVVGSEIQLSPAVALKFNSMNQDDTQQRLLTVSGVDASVSWRDVNSIVAAPAPPPDNNYTDINVTNSGATWTIPPLTVTYGKIQNVSNTSRLLGRASLGAGTIQEIPILNALSFAVTGLRWGGALTQNTIVSGAFDVTFNSIGAFNVITSGTSDIVLQNAGGTQIEVDGATGNYTYNGQTAADYKINANAAGGNYIIFTGLPTSCSGAPAGAIWNDAGDIKICP